MARLLKNNFGFYCILTQPVLGYETVTQIMVEHEIAFVQLRIKDKSESDIISIAQNLRKVTEGTNTKLIINDFVTVAKTINADGIHLGQTDKTLENTEKILGPDSTIGLSTHNPNQTIAACNQKPSYIGIGPVYKTPTKQMADPVIGLAGMETQLALSNVPAVCIGGIHQGNLKEVLKAGARNFCSVRPINESKNPGKILKELLEIYRGEVG